MLRPNLAFEPGWLDLGLGVRVRVEPLTTALMAASRNDPAVRNLPEGTSDDEIAVIFGKALAERAITDWEGVGDADGTPVAVTPEGIAALLAIWPIFERFQLAYVAKGLELDAEKKRLRALADWVYGGGDRYCAACQPCEGRGGACADCPQLLNAPRTWEGWQVWDLAGRLGGQIRALPGVVLGWDMTAALAMAEALGVDRRAAVEFLPVLEAVMARKLNEQMDDSRDSDR